MQAINAMQPTLSPHDFAAKWRMTRTKERSAAQEHFIDVCRLLGVPTPNEGDPSGENYAFEKGANKQLGGQGWADVWKRGCFAWEYKGKDADLDKAFRQLQQYRESLQNPPLLVTCDLERIVIHTNFTNTVKRVYEISLDDIEADDWVRPPSPVGGGGAGGGGHRPLALLKLIFTEAPPATHPLRPEITTERVTQEAARLFGEIAREMQRYGEQPHDTAHFLIRVLFCLFAEDVGLLPANLFREMVTSARNQPKPLASRMTQLFEAMRAGGLYGNADIRHFNGGLFDGNPALELEGNAMLTLQQVSDLDWSAVEPSIFGTLFERGLDPAKRAQLGAHYTDRSDIELIVEPVLMAPLRREWDAVKAKVAVLLPSPDSSAPIVPTPDLPQGRSASPVSGGGGKHHTRAEHRHLAEANDLINAFHDRLAGTRVLDPACGSGNFLYVALRALLSLEKEVITHCDALGLPRPALKVSPAQLFGIELNPYAHELAQATVWIGYIQWRHENGFGDPADPILRKLDNIRNEDAILRLPSPAIAGEGPGVGAEPAWPEADVIIGNPPFLGDKKMRSELGDKYVDALRTLYKGRIPGQSDLVCYWFEKARAMIEQGKAKRAGLIATQSIRNGRNRAVLDQISTSNGIFLGWSDKPWVVDGAAVRVSIICFDSGKESEKYLDGQEVDTINSNLTSQIDLTLSRQLIENANLGFIGTQKGGDFDLDFETAQKMLAAQGNPNGRPNSDVIRPWINGSEITQSSSKKWIIDFGGSMPLEDASQYEMPFEYARKFVKPYRELVRSEERAVERWWLHQRPRPEMRIALGDLFRYIVTPRVAKHRLFVFVDKNTVADSRIVVIARDDDYFFGVLHSRVHEVWSLATSSRHGVGNDPTYNNSTCFETFPFPWPPAHEPHDDPRVGAIAQAARELVEKRDRWLAEGAQAVDPAYLTGLNVAKKPKKGEARTLTNLYNQRPTWLDLAHGKLDRAVLDAYGWPHDLGDEEILSRLLALNLARAGAAATPPPASHTP
jgi:type II restriction/modification system DNA methylase subunit YeeA